MDVRNHVDQVVKYVEALASDLALTPLNAAQTLTKISALSLPLVEPLALAAASLPETELATESVQRLRASLTEFREARLNLESHVGSPSLTLALAAQRLASASASLRTHSSALLEDTPAPDTASPPRSFPAKAWRALVEQVLGYLRARRRFQGLASFRLYRAHLIISRAGVRVKIASRDGTAVDAVHLPCPGSVCTVIFCNPNAAVYELLALHSFWLDFYHKHKCDVVVWNYRGYGESKGRRLSPRSIREDIEAVVAHFSAPGRLLGVHGESIGGLPATHAATLSAVSFVVCDRAFSSLHDIALQLVGKHVTRIFWGATHWQADNVKALLAASNKSRVVLQDFADTVIPHRASLKVGLARGLLPNLLMDEALLAHSLGCMLGAAGAKITTVPDAKTMDGMVPFVPVELMGGQKMILAQWLARLMEASGGHGAVLGQAVALELTGKRGSVGDWFACCGVWGRQWPEVNEELDVGVNALNECIGVVVKELRHVRQQPRVVDAPLLIPLNCGHSGLPNAEDVEFLSRAVEVWRGEHQVE